MRTAPPARIGAALAEIWTPALLIAMPQLEANEARMRSLVSGTNIALRPHFKAHKSADIAKWQMAQSGDTSMGFCHGFPRPQHYGLSLKGGERMRSSFRVATFGLEN